MARRGQQSMGSLHGKFLNCGAPLGPQANRRLPMLPACRSESVKLWVLWLIAGLLKLPPWEFPAERASNAAGRDDRVEAAKRKTTVKIPDIDGSSRYVYGL